MSVSKWLCPLRTGSINHPDSIFYYSQERVFTYRQADAIVNHLVSRFNVQSSKHSIDYLVVDDPMSYHVWITLFVGWRTGIPTALFHSDYSLGTDFELGQSCSLSSWADDYLTHSETPPSEQLRIQYAGDQVSNYMMTSGTTGHAKIVVHTIDNHLSSAQAITSKLGITASDRWYINLPMWHVSGLAPIFRMTLSGGSLYISNQTASFGAELIASDATCISCVQTTLNRLIHDSDTYSYLRSMRVLLLGGSPIPSDNTLLPFASLPIWVSYGMTETSSAIALRSLSEYIESNGGLSMLPSVAFHLSDSSELCIKGPMVFSGYLKHADIHEQLVDIDGFFNTADIVDLHSSHIFYKGRSDRMFVSGGENIYPDQIEAILKSQHTIQSVQIRPVPDADFQMVGHAVYTGSIDPDEFMRICRKILPKSALPKHVIRQKNAPELDKDA